MLVESPYDSYPLEKLDRAMRQLRDGVMEARAHRFGLSSEFVAWLRDLVKAGY